MTKELRDQVDEALAAAERLAQAATGVETCTETLAALTEARERLETLIDEVAARAVIAGASVRSMAEVAQMAPNSLSPRLARSASLAGYAEDGRVGAEGVARARYDARTGQHRPSGPLTFTPRRSRKDR